MEMLIEYLSNHYFNYFFLMSRSNDVVDTQYFLFNLMTIYTSTGSHYIKEGK
jgi:hypothetical protein